MDMINRIVLLMIVISFYQSFAKNNRAVENQLMGIIGTWILDIEASKWDELQFWPCGYLDTVTVSFKETKIEYCLDSIIYSFQKNGNYTYKKVIRGISEEEMLRRVCMIESGKIIYYKDSSFKPVPEMQITSREYRLKNMETFLKSDTLHFDASDTSTFGQRKYSKHIDTVTDRKGIKIGFMQYVPPFTDGPGYQELILYKLQDNNR
jgi:hypothetical protein